MISELLPAFLRAEGFPSSEVQVSLLIAALLLVGYSTYSWMDRKWRRLPPGPVGLPVVGYLPFLGREPHKTFKTMTSKYGNIFGLYIGPQYTVVVNEFKVMKETLSHPAALDRSAHIFDHLLNSGFVSQNGEEWLEQRRFSINAARNLGLGKDSWEALMMEEVRSFVRELEGHGGAPVDVADRLSESVISNIMSLLIGRRLAEKDKVQLCIDYGEVSLLYTSPTSPATLMPWLRRYLELFRIAGYDRARSTVLQFLGFVRDEINRHKASPELKNVPDFINAYLEKLSELASSKEAPAKHFFSEQNLQGNLCMLFLGSSDTITSSLGWALRLMAQHQDIQHRVYAELDETLGVDGVAKYEERHNFPYTFAVCLEVERFGSIVALSGTRNANKDFEVGGYTIPKGAGITANLWALHHDPDYWQEPEQFRPERFLTPDGKELLKQVPSFAPFSVGRRNCPGEAIAWMEMLAYLSEIVKRFRVSVPPGAALEFVEVAGLVSRLAPQPLCFTPRTRA